MHLYYILWLFSLLYFFLFVIKWFRNFIEGWDCLYVNVKMRLSMCYFNIGSFANCVIIRLWNFIWSGYSLLYNFWSCAMLVIYWLFNIFLCILSFQNYIIEKFQIFLYMNKISFWQDYSYLIPVQIKIQGAVDDLYIIREMCLAITICWLLKSPKLNYRD